MEIKACPSLALLFNIWTVIIVEETDIAESLRAKSDEHWH